MSGYTRLQAEELGMKFFRGNDCKKHHGGIRYTKSGGCLKCVSLRDPPGDLSILYEQDPADTPVPNRHRKRVCVTSYVHADDVAFLREYAIKLNRHRNSSASRT